MSFSAAHENPPPAGASLRLPVLLFFGSAIFWLVVGSLLGCLAAWKLVVPALLDGIPFLTYGRVQPAAENALIYGWASQAGIGAGLWILARLGRTALEHTKLLISAAIFWNVGVLAGVCGILAGMGRSFEGLEFPGFAAVILLVAYAFIGIWSLMLLRDRASGGLYVSQWYLLAAFLWFPWLYATANMLLVWYPVQGPAQGPIAWWFGNNLIWLWLAPNSLASAYYLIPAITKRPIFAYSSSIAAFWCLAFLGGWTGVRNLVGGPVPAWMVSASVAASIMMLIPVILIGINTFGAAAGQARTPALTFILVALVCFAIGAGQSAASPLFAVVTHFSDYALGQSNLVLLGFVSLALFGAMHFIFPKLLDVEGLCPCRTGWHFWLTTIGVATIFGSLTIGGLIQGFALYDPGVTFISSINLAGPFRAMRAVGNLLFFLGALSFAGLIVQTLLEKAAVLPQPKKRRAVTV
ncbi:MAG TPA: cbb3-type cytochrome c oxidase subunit I [Terrimicrobiaceae bacterium]|nr:cbb3-type cytochrome c oxidase subunit I [Terrimicrobiaceae bacterium]